MTDTEGSEDRVDLKRLLETNPSLGELIDVITQSNTWRDNPKAIAEDLSIGLKARDRQSEIGDAFSRFEDSLEQLGTELDATSLTRKELAERLEREIKGEAP